MLNWGAFEDEEMDLILNVIAVMTDDPSPQESRQVVFELLSDRLEGSPTLALDALRAIHDSGYLLVPLKPTG